MAAENQRDSLVEKLRSLSISDTNDLAETLGQLNAIASNDAQRFTKIRTQIDVSYVYQMSKHKNKKVTFESISFLNKLLNAEPAENVIRNFGNQIFESYAIENEELQSVCIGQIFRFTQDHINVSLAQTDFAKLFAVLFKFLDSQFISIASISRKAIKGLFQNKNFDPDFLFTNNDMKNICDELLAKKAVIRFRLYEIFIDLLSYYPASIRKCSFAFDKLLTEVLNSNDMLSQMTGIEMVSNIAICCSEGFSFLLENKILEWISETVNDSKNVFILPGLIKFVGNTFSTYPHKTILQYESLLNFVLANLENDDPSIRCLCAETVAVICSNNNGLKLLFTNQARLNSAVQCIVEMTRRERDKVRERVIDALEKIFDHDPVNCETATICRELYSNMRVDPFHYLFDMVKEPFQQIRQACWKIVYSLSKFHWIETEMLSTPGFVEYLLDRTTETEKEVSEIKYAIIRRLSTSATAAESFGREFHDKFIAYSSEGPFYKESSLAVAFKEQN